MDYDTENLDAPEIAHVAYWLLRGFYCIHGSYILRNVFYYEFSPFACMGPYFLLFRNFLFELLSLR